MPISLTVSTSVLPNLFAKLRLGVSARQPHREVRPHSAGVLLPDGLLVVVCAAGMGGDSAAFSDHVAAATAPLRLSSWGRRSCGRPSRIWASLIPTSPQQTGSAPPCRASLCAFRTSSPSVPTCSSDDSAVPQQRSHSTLRRKSCSDPRLICRP